MDNWLSTRRLGILLGLMVVSGVGIYFYQQVTDKKDQEGKTALYKIQKTYEEELNALPEGQRGAGVALDVNVKFSKTVAELNGMLTSKTATARVLFEASMKLGNLYLEHGDPAKAAAAFKQMPEYGKSAFQKASGYYLLGSAQERANQPKDAIQSFQQGLSKEVEGLKGEFLVGIIRSLVKSNEAEQAKTFLEKLRKDLPGSKALEVGESLIGK